MTILSSLPSVRGRYRRNVPLADTTWFRVGGAAQCAFKPADAEDLAFFLKKLDSRFRGNDTIPVTILGAASNVVVRDGGIDGVVVRLGRGFNELRVVENTSPLGRGRNHEVISGEGHSQTLEALTLTLSQREREQSVLIEAGAANLDVNVAQFALQHSLTGLEFLSGIPGAIGGALRMNAGAYGSEIKDVLEKAEVIYPNGEITTLNGDELGFAYRHCGVPEGAIFTRAWLRGAPGDLAVISARMEEIKASREGSQPVRARTGGSTFRNPPGHKAWELIDAAGLRGTVEGGAKVSEKHCNFLINTGNATAADLERLVNYIIRQVKEHSGVTLEPEIKFIGKFI